MKNSFGIDTCIHLSILNTIRVVLSLSVSPSDVFHPFHSSSTVMCWSSLCRLLCLFVCCCFMSSMMNWKKSTKYTSITQTFKWLLPGSNYVHTEFNPNNFKKIYMTCEHTTTHSVKSTKRSRTSGNIGVQSTGGGQKALCNSISTNFIRRWQKN